MVVPAKVGGVYVAVVAPEPPTAVVHVVLLGDSCHCKVIPAAPDEPVATKFAGVAPLNKI